MRDFFAVRNPTDFIYRVIARHQEPAQYVRDLWDRSEPYLDTRRPDMAAHDFHATFWEMYLTASLRNLGLPLVSRRARRARKGGPDLQVGDVAWVEAIVATAGTGPDRVPEVDCSWEAPARSVPDRQLMVRIRAAIDAKCEKYVEYLEKEYVLPGEPFVIAINGGMLPCGRLETDVPRIVRAAFGIGELTLTYDRESLMLVKEQHAPMLSVNSGPHEFPLAFFSRPEFSFISGVIWGTADVANRPQVLGRDLTFVRNLNAVALLPHGWIREGREYWAEDGRLHHYDWWRHNVA